MPTKMRLQRHGKKANPFFHIVIADGRAPRDGKFIEKIGTYNPITNPAEINLDIDRALEWLQKGAQPTDTVRAILSYKGVLFKNHLIKGVKKGAMTEEQAEAKFQNWLASKEDKIENKKKTLEEDHRSHRKKAMEAEAKIKDERAAAIAARRLEELGSRAENEASTEEQQPAEEKAPESKAEAAPAETAAEAPTAEKPSPETTSEEDTLEKLDVKDDAPEEKTDASKAAEEGPEAAQTEVSKEPADEAGSEETAVEEAPEKSDKDANEPSSASPEKKD